VEVDVLARYVAQLLQPADASAADESDRRLLQTLRAAGFITT
jgi:hypothetical protein